MTRTLSFWIHWRTLIEVLADFSFIVIVIVTAVKWVGAGLPVDMKLVLVYALILSMIMLPINAWLGLYQRIHYRTLYDSRARAVLSLHLAIPIAAIIFSILHLAEMSREFLEMVGLGEVIVATGTQTFDAVIHRPQRRQYQHRHLVALLAQHLHDGEAIDMRQLPVGDDELVLLLGGLEQAIAAIGGDVHGVAAFAQALGQVLGGFGVVFDQ